MCDRAFRLIGAARIVRACRARNVQEVIFHSCEADIAKSVIVEVDRRAARGYLRARRTSETLFQSGMPFSSPFVCRRATATPRGRGLDLGGRERRIVIGLSPRGRRRVGAKATTCAAYAPVTSAAAATASQKRPIAGPGGFSSRSSMQYRRSALARFPPRERSAAFTTSSEKTPRSRCSVRYR